MHTHDLHGLFQSKEGCRCDKTCKKVEWNERRMGGRIILDLCGGTGAWSAPYKAAGYDVRLVTLPEQDVRAYQPPEGVHGILAAPPCTEFAVSGARWWKGKPPHLLVEAVEIAEACMRVIRESKPKWWALENPVGRLPKYIGPYRYTFQPWEYGDPETKCTCIWGEHTIPVKTPVGPPYTARVHRMPPGPERQKLRSVTPAGFAKAFFNANP